MQKKNERGRKEKVVDSAENFMELAFKKRARVKQNVF